MRNVKTIILASASPRRKKLLEEAGVKFTIVESEFEEYIDPKLKPHELVEKLSLGKAKAVYNKHKESIIIAADTLVAYESVILGKPKDKDDAREMLMLLSGKTHSLITGFTIIGGKNKIITKSKETKITMREIDKKETEKYLNTKEPYDKAGGYATQGWAKKFITKIDGDESSAIGLPVTLLLQELKKLGAF
jgi:septum formation protein